jgi:hypothetical protein
MATSDIISSLDRLFQSAANAGSSPSKGSEVFASKVATDALKEFKELPKRIAAEMVQKSGSFKFNEADISKAIGKAIRDDMKDAVKGLLTGGGRGEAVRGGTIKDFEKLASAARKLGSALNIENLLNLQKQSKAYDDITGKSSKYTETLNVLIDKTKKYSEIIEETVTDLGGKAGKNKDQADALGGFFNTILMKIPGTKYIPGASEWGSKIGTGLLGGGAEMSVGAAAAGAGGIALAYLLYKEISSLVSATKDVIKSQHMTYAEGIKYAGTLESTRMNMRKEFLFSLEHIPSAKEIGEAMAVTMRETRMTTANQAMTENLLSFAVRHKMTSEEAAAISSLVLKSGVQGSRGGMTALTDAIEKTAKDRQVDSKILIDTMDKFPLIFMQMGQSVGKFADFTAEQIRNRTDIAGMQQVMTDVIMNPKGFMSKLADLSRTAAMTGNPFGSDMSFASLYRTAQFEGPEGLSRIFENNKQKFIDAMSNMSAGGQTAFAQRLEALFPGQYLGEIMKDVNQKRLEKQGSSIADMFKGLNVKSAPWANKWSAMVGGFTAQTSHEEMQNKLRTGQVGDIDLGSERWQTEKYEIDKQYGKGTSAKIEKEISKLQKEKGKGSGNEVVDMKNQLHSDIQELIAVTKQGVFSGIGHDMEGAWDYIFDKKVKNAG